MMSARVLLAALLFVALLAAAGAQPAAAHSQSYGFVNLTIEDNRLSGTVELAVRDLDTVHDLDRNRDATITWGEFRSREAEISRAILSGLSLAFAKTPCALTPQPALTDQRGGDTYLVLPFDGACGAADAGITIGYDLLFDADAQHRGIVSLVSGSSNQSFVMTPATRTIDVGNAGGGLPLFVTWVKHGVDHILIGYDHILFVLTLLLGAAALNRKQTPGALLAQVARIVTAFTLSHSVTLALAALNIIKVPITLAESLIALTIMLAALNNLRPVLTRRIWLLALVLGLIHGVGFANVLRDLGMPQEALLTSLLAFNLGVEAGQLLVVIAAFPAVLLIMRWRHGGTALAATNLAVIAVAAMWLSDRALGTALMPF